MAGHLCGAKCPTSRDKHEARNFLQPRFMYRHKVWDMRKLG